MDRCRYCGFLKGGHDTNCPHQVADVSTSPSKPWSPEMEAWQRGYKDGRAGRNNRHPLEQDPAYQLGFRKGNSVLEEYENGYQMWGATD